MHFAGVSHFEISKYRISSNKSQQSNKSLVSNNGCCRGCQTNNLSQLMARKKGRSTPSCCNVHANQAQCMFPSLKYNNCATFNTLSFWITQSVHWAVSLLFYANTLTNIFAAVKFLVFTHILDKLSRCKVGSY